MIGGGNWATNRLIQMRLGHTRILLLYPFVILILLEPWQHVLDPLVGYICLAKSLYHEFYR